MNPKQKDILVGWLASVLSINLVGIIRGIIGWPLEWWLGLSIFNLVSFRLFSLVIDALLAFFFWLAREKLYDLHFANRNKVWHKFTLDTISFSIYKSLSYVFSLWLMTNLPERTFYLLTGVNVFLLVTTGAFNCWHMDVMKKQLPDLTRRLMAQWAKKKAKRKTRKRKN